MTAVLSDADIRDQIAHLRRRGLLCACGDRRGADDPSIPPRDNGDRRGDCGCFRRHHRRAP